MIGREHMRQVYEQVMSEEDRAEIDAAEKDLEGGLMLSWPSERFDACMKCMDIVSRVVKKYNDLLHTPFIDLSPAEREMAKKIYDIINPNRNKRFYHWSLIAEFNRREKATR